MSKVKYNIKAVFLLILSSSYSAFGKAPAIRFNGKEIAVATIKNKTILPTDSYSKPKSLIIAPLIIAIIERAMIKIVPHIMKVVIFSLLSLKNFFKKNHLSEISVELKYNF